MIKKFLLLFFFLTTSSFAAVTNDFNNLKLIGKARLKFIGFKIYDIELRGETSEFSYNQKLAIKINYNKSFSKKELIETSIKEIMRINNLEPEDIKGYETKFEKIFVDVKKGDEKIAIFDPAYGLSLIYNNQLMGKVNDKIFAKRFIDIWLSDKARFLNVRNQLIGKVAN